MIIKDLEISKELNGAELSAVRGGTVIQGAYVQGAQMSTGAAFVAAQYAPTYVSQYGTDYTYSVSETNANLFQYGFGNYATQVAL